jgi:hypothetical protein
MKRSVQLSIDPGLSPDRPVGRILPSVITGSNADLIAAIAPLYLTGTVCDLTYGTGGWWKRYRPDQLVAHDLDTAKGDGIDFTNLPEADNTYDAVVFDPPYIPQGGVETSSERKFIDHFGLAQRSETDLWLLIDSGLVECSRVSRRWVITKCSDFVNGGRLVLGHIKIIELAATHSLTVHDIIVHHTGSGPGGWNIFDVKRARRNHSYLIVFRVGR